MHIRWSSAIGTEVTEEHSGDLLGRISGILIHPDTGKIEGFFVRMQGFLHSDYPFLGSIDILSWGLRIEIRDRDVLSPVEERVRLGQMLAERREFLSRPILSESGRFIGRCRDVQFETDSFHIEWIFPRKLFRWKVPIPLTQILEVRREAIVVRDTAAAVPAQSVKITEPLLKTLPDPV